MERSVRKRDSSKNFSLKKGIKITAHFGDGGLEKRSKHTCNNNQNQTLKGYEYMQQQPYFKVYQSLFKNESYVTKMTDLEKVLLMLISSEMNRKEAEGEATGRAKIMRFSHWWVASALSTNRVKLSKPFKTLSTTFGLFDYTSGFHVNGGRTAPSMIQNLVTEEFFCPIDRYTFEYLLYDQLKSGKIKYRHIVVYALCKYIEQFEGGSISVNDFGRMLGMASKEIKYTRIKKPLEDLQSMKLISFQKAHGKIQDVQAHQLPLSRLKQHKLREDIRLEAEKLRYEEWGINKEISASLEDMPEAENLDDVISNVKDIFAKRFGKQAVLNADQKRKIHGIELSIREIHENTEPFFREKYDVIRQSDGKSIFSLFANYMMVKSIEKYYQPSGQV